MHRELDRLVGLYDRGNLSRRELIHGLLTLAVGVPMASPLIGGLGRAGSPAPLFRTHTLNHVTLLTSDVARSRAFYQGLTGLPIRAEGKDFCEFRLEKGFLGLYALGTGEHPGFDHFCFGIDGYDAHKALAALEAAVPESKPTLDGDQVYVRDPDGVRVQFADVHYKR